MKKGEKGLKNANFWVINFKSFRGGLGEMIEVLDPVKSTNVSLKILDSTLNPYSSII